MQVCQIFWMFLSNEYTRVCFFSLAPGALSLADQAQAHLCNKCTLFCQGKSSYIKETRTCRGSLWQSSLVAPVVAADASHDRRIDGGYDATYATIHTGGHLLSLALDHQRWMCHLLLAHAMQWRREEKRRRRKRCHEQQEISLCSYSLLLLPSVEVCRASEIQSGVEPNTQHWESCHPLLLIF